MQPVPIVGVLALQGDYESHARALEQVNAEPQMVRTAAELEQVDGLIIPGGESTTFLKLLEREGLFDPLKIRPYPSDIWNLCRMHPAGKTRHPSGAGEPRCPGCDGGTQCLWPSD